MTKEEFKSLKVGDKVKFYPERISRRIQNEWSVGWVKKVMHEIPDGVLRVKGKFDSTISVYDTQFTFSIRWIEIEGEDFLTEEDMKI